MRHTKEQLQAMSDFEVNKALTELVYKDVYFFDRQSDTQKALMLAPNDASGPIDILIVDYCNTPNDIMPLAFANLVGVTPMVARWKAYTIGIAGVDLEFEDKNPLRAIACCLILILQEQKLIQPPQTARRFGS